ncbi:hypothetical protein KC19_8G029700 [Ceratodon purpureus]|uniref:Adenine DNA glycosylase n=1 Tax=Ceratodon purpureus TaxID=3225 RepID=A0A8T0GYX2_CERPU|nr:hypothetical protein KC19_8G029700 [Ceratodon purpureus]
MVMLDRALCRVLPPMAPTTRSARLSVEVLGVNSKAASSSKGGGVMNLVVKGDVGYEEERSLKVYKAKGSGKAEKGSQRRGRIGVKKDKKVAPVDSEDGMVMDMEDFCSSGGSLAEPSFSESEVMAIRTGLLSWYDRNHRVLPWRINLHSCFENPSYSGGEHDEICKGGKKEASSSGDAATDFEGERAYAVWVSEIMLQQTRVATVISYYQRWMSMWPTVHALAQASQEEVNTVWAGLGYYRRARFLLEGAKKVVQDLGGKFPRTVEELQKVPGIGSYTAGAIGSIAFKQAVPVVDGNVIRVLCRLRAISLNPKASTTVKLFWALASQLVDDHRPGDFNQALMELGATTCTPTSPSCTSCPISSQCTALKLVSRVEKKVASVTCFPMKVLKSAPREEYVAVCIVEREAQSKTEATSSLLLVQRPLKGLLAGLWEFPSAPLGTPDSSEESRLTAMDEYLHDILGIELGRGSYSVIKREEFGTYIHVFSHIRLHMFIQWLQLRREVVEDKNAPRMQSSVVSKWVDLDSMNNLGLTTGVKKVYKMFSALREKQLTSKATKRKRSKVV